jgi:hypothetical protein
VTTPTRTQTYTLVVVVPESSCSKVKPDREGESAEEDGGDKDGVSLEERRVDWLCVFKLVYRVAVAIVRIRPHQSNVMSIPVVRSIYCVAGSEK